MIILMLPNGERPPTSANGLHINSNSHCRGFIKTMSAASFTNVAAEEKKAKDLARKQAKEAEKGKDSNWRTKLSRKNS